jgi:hypothetical protein
VILNRNKLLLLFAAFLLLITQSVLSAPAGQITANPEVAFVPPGGAGTTLISWSTINTESAQVTVQATGGEEQTFGDATSFQNSPAPWIGLTTFTFRLYGDRTRTLLLDSVVVTGVPAPSGSITATPLSFNLASAEATFSTTLSWTTSGSSGAWVTRSAAGGGETFIAQGVSSSGFQVSGLSAGETVFRLYADEARTQLLGWIVVTGILPLPGSITANPSNFTVGVGATFSTALSWTTSEGSIGWVTRSAAGASEELVSQGGSTSGFEVSGLGAGRTVFRLYGDEARTQLLNSAEVIGTASPLTVQADGTLRLENRPFSGVGVNYYSAFERVLDKSDDTSYDSGFAALSRWGVPFARLDVSGYWPSKTQMFFTDREEYFRRLDGVVASAEKHAVALIPSLFWTTFTFSDLAGEHLDQLAVNESLTRQKMREFATEIINRYKGSPAIWAWEFGNEWSLAVDLPNGAEFLPPTHTNLGNPATRDSVRDVLTTDIMLPAMLEFAYLVSELDPGRPISTGHATLRPSQWHQDQWQRGLLDPAISPWSSDSPEQAREIALRHCPDPYNLLSIHVYESDADRLPLFASAATGAGKVLFIGEFGTLDEDAAEYDPMLTAIRSHSPLAAVWVFDRPRQVEDPWNITPTNSRSWMLRNLLPNDFQTWSRGWGAMQMPAHGQTAFSQYVFGVAYPGGMAPAPLVGLAGEFLELTVVVRANDTTLAVYGQYSDSLQTDSWSSEGVQQQDSQDQTDVLPGCVRRVYRVPIANSDRKFFRIHAEGHSP